MVELSSQSYVFDPRPNYPLVSTARRYWRTSSHYVNDSRALTLIFAHGTGFHKEQFEPTIEHLFELLEAGNVRVRDVWTIDAPNHGDAAILNEKVLLEDFEPLFRWEEYARSLYNLLTGFGSGIDVDFSQRRLIGIGHSMGGNCLLLAQTYGPNLKFESMILVELMSVERRFMEKPSGMLLKGAVSRRDVWSSKEEAYQWMKSRPAWKVWDDQVLRRFVNDGLRPLPTLTYPDGEGVTLKCTKNQEAACYRDNEGPFKPYRLLQYFVKRLPIHMMYGTINDYLSQEAKDDVLNNAVGGIKNLSSFQRIAGAGHLAPQMKPEGLASAIYKVLAIPAKL